MRESYKLVYICSAGHSGSTLISLILGSHSQATALGEVPHLPKNIALNSKCSCGSNLNKCEMWSRVILGLSDELGANLWHQPYRLNLGVFRARDRVDNKRQNRVSIALDRARLALRYAELRYGIRLSTGNGKVMSGLANSVLLFEAVTRLEGKPIIVDSSKSYLRAAGLYKTHPNRMKIVLLVRDGRGVFNSGLKSGYSARKSVSNWKNVYTRGLPLLQKHVKEGDAKIVRYEDLVERTDSTLHELCRFMGISYESKMKEFWNFRHHIVNGNDMRLSSRATMKLDEKWRTELTEEQLSYFDRAAGEINRSFGYK